MACASRSPFTTSASIGDCVRNTVTRSAMGPGSLIEGAEVRRNARSADLGRDRLLDLHQDHRHVVVLIGGADERLDLVAGSAPATRSTPGARAPRRSG